MPPPDSCLPKEEGEKTGQFGGKASLPFFELGILSQNPKTILLTSSLLVFLSSLTFRSADSSFRKLQRPPLHSQDCLPCKSPSTLINFSKSSQILDFDRMSRRQPRVRVSKLAWLVNTEKRMTQFRKIYRVPPSITLK